MSDRLATVIWPALLLMAKRPPALSVSEYVFVSPISTSLPLTVPTTVPLAACSATVFADKARSVGASLTFATVTARAWVSVPPWPSDTCTVTSYTLFPPLSAGAS